MMKKEWKWGTENDYYVRTAGWSPPGDHPIGCGMILHVKDGKLAGVEGDEEHPINNGRLCIRCLSLPEYVHHPQRIIYPLKRAGKRGGNKWTRITWDEALDTIEQRTKEINAKYGSESIVVFQGTGREATQHSYALASAVFKTPNACYAQSGWSCYGPRLAVDAFVFGGGYPEIDYAAIFEDRYDNPNYRVPEYIVLWGKSPLASNPDGFYGHSLIDMYKRGAKFISVDPRVNWLATRSEYHLQLRPGADAAMALGWLNVIINEDLYDHDFVDNWTLGFDELAERVQEYTPERVAEITWVPAETIRAAARAFAKANNAGIQWGLAIDAQPNGVQAGHAIICLLALTGNVDIPGGNILGPSHSLLGNWRFNEAGAEMSDELRDKRIGQEFPGVLMSCPTAHPDSILDTLETDQPYPLRMAFISSSNFMSPTCSAQPKRWYEAMKKMEFVVATDIFMNPTISACADIFLPVATFAEKDAVVFPHFGRNTQVMSSINKALTVGEAKSDLEITRLIGRRLNPSFWKDQTDAEFFTDRLADGDSGITFEMLREMGAYSPPNEYRKHEKGKLRPDGEPGFRTVTGFIELCSSLYPNFDEDPLPYFVEPPFSPVSTPGEYAKYPLILTTGVRKFTSFHSEHRQIQSLRAIDPWPEIEIHPDTAAAYGIKAGDWVEVENMFGSARLKADITPIVHPKVVQCRHGWWYPEQDGAEPNLYGVWKSNINSLIPHKHVGKIGYGAPYKCMICRIRKADGAGIEY